MPYVLSPIISKTMAGLWGEGGVYSTENIYEIESGSSELPPVHYDAHTLKPHSIPHVDAPGHIITDGKTTDSFFREDCSPFFGPVTVVHLDGAPWENSSDSGASLWRVSAQELASGLSRVTGSEQLPDKLFLSVKGVPINEFGFHDPSYVLVLSSEAAELLVSNKNFNAFGTSWKSSDYEPGSRERPVHKILLQQALLYECLRLDHVSEGQYFLSAFPLALEGSTESPVTPVLFEASELPKIAD